MEFVNAEKEEVIAFLKDISRFLTPAYLGIGCVGLVRTWSDVDFVQLDAVFSWLSNTAVLTLARYLVLTLSLTGIGLVVFASVYYLARVYRYVRYVTPVSARRLYTPFSLIFAGSSTMVGMLAPYVAISKLESHRINLGLFQTVSTISLTLLGLSFATLGFLLYAIGRRWWEGKGFERVCALLCLLAVSLPVYPLGLVVTPSALLLVKGLITHAVNGGTPMLRKVSGSSVVRMVLCSLITLGMASSVIIQSSPLIHSLPTCPSQLAVSVVQVPTEESDKRSVGFLLVIANPTEKTLIINYSTISLTINGFKHMPIPMDVPHFFTDMYSIYLLYCDNCALHLAPRTASIYMYRVEIVGEEPTTLVLGLDAVVGVQRKDYVYMCGRYVEDNLVVLG